MGDDGDGGAVRAGRSLEAFEAVARPLSGLMLIYGVLDVSGTACAAALRRPCWAADLS